MFNLIRVGERAESGVPEIFNVWEEEGWIAPIVEEFFKADRTILTLSFADNQAETSGKSSQEQIRAFLLKNDGAKTEEIAAYLGLRAAWTRVLIAKMVDEGVVVAEGNSRARRCFLAEKSPSKGS